MTFGEVLLLFMGILAALLGATILFAQPKQDCSTTRVIALNFSAQILVVSAAIGLYAAFSIPYSS